MKKFFKMLYILDLILFVFTLATVGLIDEKDLRKKLRESYILMFITDSYAYYWFRKYMNVRHLA